MALKKVSEIINDYQHINDNIISLDKTYSSFKIEDILKYYLQQNDPNILLRSQLKAGYKIQFQEDLQGRITINALIDSTGSAFTVEDLISLLKETSYMSNDDNIDLTPNPFNAMFWTELNPPLRNNSNWLDYRTLADLDLYNYDPLIYAGLLSTLEATIRNDFKLEEYNKLKTYDRYMDGSLPAYSWNAGIITLLNPQLRNTNFHLNNKSLQNYARESFPPVSSGYYVYYPELINKRSKIKNFISLLSDFDKEYPVPSRFEHLFDTELIPSYRKHNENIDYGSLETWFDCIRDYRPLLQSWYTTIPDHIKHDRTQVFFGLSLDSDLEKSYPYATSFDSNINIDENIPCRTKEESNLISLSDVEDIHTLDELLPAPERFTYIIRKNIPNVTGIITNPPIIFSDVTGVYYKVTDDENTTSYTESLETYPWVKEKDYQVSVALRNNYSDYTLPSSQWSQLNYSLPQTINVTWSSIFLYDKEWSNVILNGSIIYTPHALGQYIDTENMSQAVDIYDTLTMYNLSASSVYNGADRSILLGTIQSFKEVSVHFDINYYGANYNANTYYNDGYGFLNNVNARPSTTYYSLLNAQTLWFGSAVPNFTSPPASFNNANFVTIDMNYNFETSTATIQKNGIANTTTNAKATTTDRLFTTAINNSVSYYDVTKKNTSGNFYFCFSSNNYNNALRTKTYCIRNFHLKLKSK
jgi:hypothetical protein